MKLQIPLLPLRKPPNILLLPNRYPHPLQRRPMRHRRNEQPPIPLECDEPAVEQVIDRRRQQQAVLAIETLRIAAVPPGLAVTRAQMLDAFDARDATAPRLTLDGVLPTAGIKRRDHSRRAIVLQAHAGI